MRNLPKKRLVLVIVILCLLLINAVAGRVFTGGVEINAGHFNDFYLRVITPEKVIFAEPGKTKKFDMFIRRGTMEKIAHDVEVIDADENFQLSVDPEVIPQIRNIDQIRLQASLYVPPDIQPGDYPLRINVKGKEFIESSYPLDTMISVGGRMHYLNYLFILLTFIIIIFIIWRQENIEKLDN